MTAILEDTVATMKREHDAALACGELGLALDALHRGLDKLEAEFDKIDPDWRSRVPCNDPF